MKKTDKENELEMVKAIHAKNPSGALAIDLEFYEHQKGDDFTVLMGDICAGRISTNSAMEGTLQVVSTIAELAAKDFLNVQNCFGFLRAKYPHALITFSDFTIGVENLTPDEIKDCLAQANLKFTYYENPEHAH